MIKRLLPLLGAALTPAPALAQSNAFDLAGPDLRVTVSRGQATLPVAQVPNLQAGDRISVKAMLPPDQEAHYLLVGAFLRGATNPPPRDWFSRAETWRKGKDRLELTVPEGAQQLILFLVPETGGDYRAVVRAVRGQPGVFTRAVQDLNQAALDRARTDALLSAIQGREASAPDAIPPTLTKSLGIRLDTQCLDRRPELQAACLTRRSEAVVLSDRQRDSFTETLTGAPVDLAIQLSNTPAGGYGYYSPYIGVLRDVARLFGAFRSAQFQYIPTLARWNDERIGLLLNAAPSFRNPKSVLVVPMPPVEASAPPPLRAPEPRAALCATRRDLVLPVAGAPLIYATDHAHGLHLRVAKPDGGTAELPVRADPERGGFVPAAALRPDAVAGDAEAVLHGSWGFTSFDGPRYRLQSPAGRAWRTAGDEATSLVVGRENQLELVGGAASCVSGVELEDQSKNLRAVEWSVSADDRLLLKLPLARARSGPVTLLVRHHGQDAPARLALKALSEAGRLDGLAFHAGDVGATLTGTRLDLIESVAVDGLLFKPGALVREGQVDRLSLAAADPAAARALVAGEERTARVSLTDGRRLALRFTVTPPRPSATLINRSVFRPTPDGALRIAIADEEAVPHDAKLTFSIRAAGAIRFDGRETVEVASAAGSAPATLRPGEGVMLQDAQVAVASFEPGGLLGPSAHGPLRFRVVRDGVAGDWTDLGTLVRLPTLTNWSCPAGGKPCTLRGENLFLLAAVAPDARFASRVDVPDGFTGATLTVPASAGKELYLRLRDGRDLVASVPRG
ncbi:hypothetical protein [Sphingomonas lenta]|uniref:Uncharacterized protein n=1 Tax=Sphingomonas lenta TaxID=1141887 RepID=A0A2A2SGD7_9SPHN|nr:hypothetical protein [Sphingomonas lenta]PAX08275.1 hypothetical protein CKY28_12015 [Sphingomonas lenta]